MFTKEDIRGARNTPVKVPVEINGKKGFVFVRGMTGAEKDSWENEQFEARKSGDKKKLEQYRASQYVRVVCDESGKLVFMPEDASWIKDLPCHVLEAPIEEGQKLSGVSPSALEDAEKNLKGDQSADST